MGAKFVKIVLIIGGALAVAVALGLDVARATGEISFWTILGLIGAGLVALGSIFDAIRETDASRALSLLPTAPLREAADWHNENEALDKAVTRGLDLYNSLDVLRGAIEQSLDLPNASAPAIIQAGLTSASSTLLGAFDFGVKDLWKSAYSWRNQEGNQVR